MSNKQKWGYDQDKKMLSKIRSLNESYILTKRKLTEEEEPQTDSDNKSFTAIDDGIGIEVMSNGEKVELTTDQRNSLSQLIENFKDQVSDMVNFPVGFNIKDNEVRLDGELNEKDISFVLIRNDETPGIFINCEMTKIDSDVMEFLEKLQKFEHAYMDAVSKLLEGIKQGNL